MKTVKVVAAVIKKDGKIFATQRGYGEFKDRWEFPGGKIEPGESPEEALIREIKEELGADINVGPLLDTIEYDYPDFHLSMECYQCALLSDELILKEHEAARWLSEGDLMSVDWLPADISLAQKLNSPKKIALLGAGAVGSYIIMGLFDKFGDNFMLVAKGERADCLKKEGRTINGRTYLPRVVSPEEAGAENPDFLIVAVKYTALRGSLDDIAACVSSKTTVVSLLNGIDSEEIIAKRIGDEHLLYSFVKIASTRKGNSVSFILPNETSGIFAGEVPGRMPGPENKNRAEEFKALFDNTDVLCHINENILAGIWEKFAINISRNLPQAVIGAGCGAYNDSSYMADLSCKLKTEIFNLAAAKGIYIPEGYKIAPAKPSQRYSTLQDLDAKRETEIEMFSGAALRVAKELGVPCPYNEVMYDLIKALEEKNEGKFDY